MAWPTFYPESYPQIYWVTILSIRDAKKMERIEINKKMEVDKQKAQQEPKNSLLKFVLYVTIMPPLHTFIYHFSLKMKVQYLLSILKHKTQSNTATLPSTGFSLLVYNA